MPKKGEKRPDDVHMAEKQAIDVLVPVEEPVSEDTQAPPTKSETNGPPGEGAPALAPAIEELVPYAGTENSEGGNVDVQQEITLRSVEKQIQQVVAEEGTPQQNEVVAKLQTQIDELRGDLATVRRGSENTVTSEGPAGYPWQYYRRPERPNDPYGVAPIPSEVYRMGPGADFINILKNGGAKEFPISQVLTLKWHLKCPVPGTRFEATEKAIQEGKVKRFVCPDCDLELWFEHTDNETPLVCFRHMRAKRVPDDGRHGISRSEAREVMNEIGVLIGGLTPVQEVEKAQTSA